MKLIEAMPPLPEHWRLIDSIDELLHLVPQSTQIRLVGFEAHGPGHLRATGSAAAPGSASMVARSRAWLELLERAAIAEFDSRQTTEVPPSNWSPSRSNGVALGIDERSAQLRAWMERIERHLILNHWEMRMPPVLLSKSWLRQSGIPNEMDRVHDFHVVHFPNRSRPTVHVCGIIGFPRTNGGILLAGWGTSTRSRADAIKKATSEVLQTAGFLHNMRAEDFVANVTADSGPEAHLNYFQSPDGQEEMRSWLFPDHQGCGLRSELPSETSVHQFSDATFTDLTPAWLPKPWRVFRCESNSLIELRFGRREAQSSSYFSEGSRLHPIW